MRSVAIAIATVAILAATMACSSVTTVRLQPEAIEVGPGMRPIAAIQANAISAYFLFIPLPGGVELDKVINRMLVVTAKTMGADKITNVKFDITPEQGIWVLRKLVGWRSAQASGIAVQLTASAPDPNADLGPEPPRAEPARDRAPPGAPGSQ